MKEQEQEHQFSYEKTLFIFKMKKKFTSWEYDRMMGLINDFAKKLEPKPSGEPNLNNLFLVLPESVDLKVVCLGPNKAKRKNQFKRMIRIGEGL